VSPKSLSKAPILPVKGVQAIAQAIGIPSAVAADVAGGFYFCSETLHRIYRVASDGSIGLIAGAGSGGFSGDGSSATAAQPNSQSSVAVISAQNMGCHLIKAEDNPLGKLVGMPSSPPVIWGDAVTVPAFHLRFVASRTREVLKAEEVGIVYGWKWLEYPYPEHAWGAWSDASDLVECVKLEMAEYSIQQFEVKLRGWYEGKYTKFPFGKKPSFNGLTIAFTVLGCHTSAEIKRKEAMALTGKKVVVNVDVAGCYTTKISYTKN
jgi:hypothetical protein